MQPLRSPCKVKDMNRDSEWLGDARSTVGQAAYNMYTPQVLPGS